MKNKNLLKLQAETHKFLMKSEIRRAKIEPIISFTCASMEAYLKQRKIKMSGAKPLGH